MSLAKFFWAKGKPYELPNNTIVDQITWIPASGRQTNSIAFDDAGYLYVAEIRGATFPYICEIYRADGFSNTKVETYDTPLENIRSLTWGEGYLWVMSTQTKVIDQVLWSGPSSSVISSRGMPSNDTIPGGVGFQDGNLLYAGRTSGNIPRVQPYVGISTNLATNILLNGTLGTNSPTGVAFDGKNMIVTINQTIYVFDGVSSTLITGFAAPAGIGNITDVSFFAGHLYVIAGSNKIYKLGKG